MASFFWVLGIALIAHFSFSHLGFNIGDDGFCLALAQRVLWGQVPHLDYSSLRPIGSGLLWAPIIALAKEYSYLAVRFLSWWQFSFISWQWSGWALSAAVKENKWLMRSIHLLTFMVGTSVFSYYGWNTVDGLFFSTLGIWVLELHKRSSFFRLTGYFIIGLSALFKQNFLALACAVPLIKIFQDQKSKFEIGVGLFLGLLPLALYMVVISWLGGGNEMIEQMSTYQDLSTPGFWAYVGNKSFYRGMIWALLLLVTFQTKRLTEKRKNHILTFLVLGFWAYLMTIWADGKWTYKGPFFLFGTTACFLIGQLAILKWEPLPWIALIGAWVSSISGGYQTPIIGVLLLMPVVVRLWWEICGHKLFLFKRIMACVLILTTPLWVYGRRNFIYGEWPAAYLVASLDGVLPGGRGLLTTTANAQALTEIRDIARLFPGQKIAIIPDHPGFWINYHHPNPLKIDWANHYELPNRKFEEKLLLNIKSFKGQGEPLFLIPKFAGHTFSTLGQGNILARQDRREFLTFVTTEYTPVYDGQYFKVYRP